MVVDSDPAPLANLEAGFLRQPDLRAHADAKHHEVSANYLAFLREHLERALRRLPEFAHVRIEDEVDAILDQMALDVACHFRIHGG